MTEELVTLETAKMLKEKGFNEYHYPIQSIAAKSLIPAARKICPVCSSLTDRSLAYYNTYEEALEAGIQEAVKLI